MLKLDTAARCFVPVSPTSLAEANILERADFQAAIVASWDAFCAELGFDELFYVGSEIEPHDSCRDRIDILALSREGTPVVFELKRHRDRLQLLQAIAYAAMVAKWDAQRFLTTLGGRNDESTEELRSLLADESFELRGPEIVLVAESYDPEVVLAADWLTGFGVPISAFSVSSASHSGDTLISFDQKFPLPGLDDVYVRRTQRAPANEPHTSWDEALTNVEFPFARRAVDIFRRRIAGSPHRRAFFSIYASSPLGRMSIAFKRRYLKIYTTDQSPEAEQILRDRLSPMIEFTTWGNENTKNSGFTFTIETEPQFDHFLKAVGESTT